MGEMSTPGGAPCSCRCCGLSPEAWEADTGIQSPLAAWLATFETGTSCTSMPGSSAHSGQAPAPPSLLFTSPNTSCSVSWVGKQAGIPGAIFPCTHVNGVCRISVSASSQTRKEDGSWRTSETGRETHLEISGYHFRSNPTLMVRSESRELTE